ncbi:cytochrome-c peroxidase [Sulfurimonas sp. HSL3-7]|uniref:cytochrome-c peroxidase n=1 Tax=Sulfonitrofixus jiaomeiensis TaxID=3131938 RepID=UPI0031F9EA55
MKMKHLLLTFAVGATVMASPLLKEAKDNGLVAIPADKAALNKLTENPKNKMTPAKVELGKKLYFDPRLSKSGLISCNTCHNLSEGGDDGVGAAIGHNWTANPHHLNSPSVYNAVFAEKQFWDGRSPDLEDQAKGPMLAAPEMAASTEHIEAVVKSMPEYVAAFKNAYGKDVKIDFNAIAETIGLFERTLVTPSRFDDFLNGDEKALTKAEKEGLKTFIATGCTSCHTGIAIGGGMQGFAITGDFKHAKVGDFKGDANGLVKTPTLRNVTQTAPYFHNGTVWSLKEAIQEMGRIQLGVKISDKDAASIETFLKALDGRKPEIVLPILPASTEATPKPDVN